MTMRQADHERLDRLAGDGNSVAGIDLAALFRVILDQIQDGDGVSAGSLAGPVRDALTNHARIEHLYRKNGEDSWPALMDDALRQLEVQGLAACGKDGTWRTAAKFGTGRRLTVIPARKGKHGSVGLTLYPAGERAARGEAEKQRMEITSLAASLREDGPGLRPVNPAHVDALAQKMRDFGYRPEFPVLVDQHGRILDGRHRVEAARKAGVSIPQPRVIRFSSDEDAFIFATLVNEQRGWTKAERGHINSILQAAGLSMENLGQRLGKREAIRIALLENPQLSHNAIAKRLGVSPQTIMAHCRELMANSQIENCGHTLTEDGKQAPGPKPKAPRAAPRKSTPALQEEVAGLVAQGKPVPRSPLAAKHGVGESTVQDEHIRAKARAEALAQAPQQPEVPPGVPEAPQIGDLPSWQMMAELFQRLPDEDQALFLQAIGVSR